LGKTGGFQKTAEPRTFNLTRILKKNLLEDDGMEDMHFYIVAFQNHRQNIIEKME
jgi:hypothetical protein